MSTPPDPSNSFEAFMTLGTRFTQILLQGFPAIFQYLLILMVPIVLVQLGMRWGYARREADEKREHEKFKYQIERYFRTLAGRQAIEDVPVEYVVENNRFATDDTIAHAKKGVK